MLEERKRSFQPIKKEVNEMPLETMGFGNKVKQSVESQQNTETNKRIKRVVDILFQEKSGKKKWKGQLKDFKTPEDGSIDKTENVISKSIETGKSWKKNIPKHK